jgi:hypothetical protein
MTGLISQVLRNSLVSDVQTSDLASLGRQNTELSALTLQLKEFSPTIVALDKQNALLAEYNSRLALDLNSLATYFGLLTAGMAVALQSVILAAFSHFLLIGKYGIRIGDRVQISGITGDIIDMGLLHMQNQCFTGHVATFSNSLVFISPATSLLKFDSSPETWRNSPAFRFQGKLWAVLAIQAIRFESI